ncbi:putative surface protein with fasciclin (FAS1) repeats [Micromonospora pisi]|uniref:Putative surface protein with fasciclin (FAS1) repeats n=1 Tax=Micromonospora pisi TaxID=589240 RepID=A0A495JBK4_9ACTN|nr:fasciclin domain-containing protein [Micromonospora pisi]RKR86297.1 putative surface protein with fasciclin (FAS1) repeats [Micromonospora pisi]
MSEPSAPYHPSTLPGTRRSRTAPGLAVAALLLALVATGCTGTDHGERGATQAAPAPVGVTGPLCDVLPAGTDPGNPASLAGEPVDVALQWIPVLTRFEAALRASGLAPELRGMTGLTILAPTDDAFGGKFSEDTLDELFIERKDDLRALLKAHIVDGSHPLAELVAAGRVTTLDGTPVEVTASGTMARVAGQAGTLCADYRAVNARIHIIDKVLGKLPTDADGGEHRSH